MRLSALSGIGGAITFVALIVIGGAISDGYSHAGQAISELSARDADHAGLQTLNFVIFGLCVIVFARALYLLARPPLVATLLLGLFGLLSSLGQAMLPCDAGCEPETAVGTAHIITGTTGFVAALAAMFLLARHWRQNEQWRAHARQTRVLAYLGLASLIAFNITKASGAQSIDGLAQRAFALWVLIWLGSTSIELYRRSDPASVLTTG